MSIRDQKRHAQAAANAYSASSMLDALEPRTLLTAYVAEPLAERLDIPETLFNLAPPEGVETAGFGTLAVRLGDVNDDGADDFAVTAPRRAAGEQAAVNGAVFVFSGEDRSLIEWIPEALNVDAQDDVPLPTGRVVPLGEVVRLYWNPGDEGTWNYQNLTQSAV